MRILSRFARTVGRRLACEAGQSLPELLVAIVIGAVVLAGITEVTVTTMQASARTQDRIDSQQTARLAISRLLVALDSQICPSTGQNFPIVAWDGSTASDGTTGSNGTSISFFYDNPTAAGVSSIRADRMTYTASRSELVEERFPDASFTGVPQRIVYSGIAAPSAGPFRYYAYNGVATDQQPTKPVDVSAGLTSTDAPTVVHVRVDLTAFSRRTGTIDGRSTAVSGDAYNQVADPDAANNQGATCRQF